MKVIEERRTWIHTHFVIDSFYITAQEQRTVSMRVEPELKQMGIQYGLHYKNAPSEHHAIIVLECLPFDHITDAIKQLIDETIEKFPSRIIEKKNVVTKITAETPEGTQGKASEGRGPEHPIFSVNRS
jgi:hypothetical protein